MKLPHVILTPDGDEAMALDWANCQRIPGAMWQPECEWLHETAKTVQSWTELGVLCGRSAWAVATGLPRGARLTLVDRRFGELIRNNQTALSTYLEIAQRRPDLQIIMARMESAESATVLADTDVVFIDASHDRENCRRDIAAWKPKARLVCGHDYCDEFPGVIEAVDAAFPQVRVAAGSIWIAEES